MKSTRAARPDAITLLRADHAEVKQLFAQYETLAKGSSPSLQRKRALSIRICKALIAHTTIEEEIFYPAIGLMLHEDLMFDEAEVEHATAKSLIDEILSMEPDEPKFDAKVIVLGEYIAHHVSEEHKEMFPKARKLKLDFKMLGAMMLVRKNEIMRSQVSGARRVSEVTVSTYVPRGAGA